MKGDNTCILNSKFEDTENPKGHNGQYQRETLIFY